MPLLQGRPSNRGLAGIKPEQLAEHLGMKPFKFIVGPDQVKFYIHRGFLSRLSAPLNSMVNGGTKESLEGCVTLEHVDDGVFSRFAQFVYTGDYTSFTPVEDGPAGCSRQANATTANVVGKRPDDKSPKEPVYLSLTSPGILPISDRGDAFKLPYSLVSYKTAATGRAHSPFCKRYKPPLSKAKLDTAAYDCQLKCEASPSEKKQAFISAFMSRQGDLASTSSADIWQTRSVRQTKSFEHVFIGHVRIWAFAHRYAIASLKELACSHLVHELARWTITTSAFVSEFGGLVRYVYDGRAVGGHQLRLLVAQFAACVVEDVCGLEGWPALLNEVPDFAADLVNQMMNRFR